VKRTSLVVAFAIGALAIGLHSQNPSAPLDGERQRFLKQGAGFSPAQVQALERGEAIATILDTDRRQIAILGAIRIHARASGLLDRYRDMSPLRNNPVILQAGTFGVSPRVEDLQPLTFEAYDLETIKACKPGDCGVRLPAQAMERFSREIDWQRADWSAQAASLWRRLLVEYTESYIRSGALAEYRNREDPLSVAREFDVLFEDSRNFTAAAPEFFGYVRDYPRYPLAGVENLFYWTKDTMGARPVTSITHLALRTAPADGSGWRPPVLAATKQIWATHYFDAGLGLTIAFDDHAGGFYMVCLNRVRTRSLTSLMRTFVRSAVQKRSRDAMEAVLLATRRALERPK